VTTIISRQNKLSRAAIVGAFWGLGHTLTIFIVGAIIIFFNLVIPPRVGLTMELAVGLMLVFLGVLNIKSFLRSQPEVAAHGTAAVVHDHLHSHGDYFHSHVHGHEGEAHSHAVQRPPLGWFDVTFGRAEIYQNLRPLMIGIVHGLAGSAAVALLVLATIRDPRWAIAYLLVFGLGTVAGMVLITISIASTLRALGKSKLLFRRLALASGLLSLGFGLAVAYQICITSGLLTGAPKWVPR